MLNRKMSSATLEKIIDLILLTGINIKDDLINLTLRINTPINLEKYDLKLDDTIHYDIYKQYGLCVNKT